MCIINSLLELLVLQENDVAREHHEAAAGVLVLERLKVLQTPRFEENGARGTSKRKRTVRAQLL